MTLPDFLTHYYEKSTGPFSNLSMLPPEQAEQVLEEIRRAGNRFASRRADDYLRKRRELEIPRVVFASSNHASGAYHGFDPDSGTFTEPSAPMISPDDPVRPDSEYGVSKVFGEAIARYYSDRWELKATCLRIGAVIADDDPTRDPQNRRIWFSRRDLVQLVEKSLRADVAFGIYFGISNNQGAFWDISNARADLGFEPVDDGSRR